MRKKCGLALAVMGLVAYSGTIFAQEVSASKNYKVTDQKIVPGFSVPAVVAKVNGVDIPTQQFWDRMLNQFGNAVLLSLVDDLLVEQAAEGKIAVPLGNPTERKSKKIKRSLAKSVESEVEKRFADLKKQFADEASFVQQLKNSGLDVEMLKRQIRIDLYKTKLLEDKIKVTKKEIKKYFDENKEKLAQPAVLNQETQKGIEQLLKQDKFNREYPQYIQALRQQAKIEVFLTQ